jgi:TolA-binding protein
MSDPRFEWRISDIERTLQGKADKYALDSISGYVDSLERANRSLRYDVDDLRSRLDEMQARIENVERQQELHE